MAKRVIVKIPISTYPIYNNPIVVTGDALILPDLEAPFHDAEFVNRALSLAGHWGIDNLILAGDAMHWQSLSGWGSEWKSSGQDNDQILKFMQGLDKENSEKGIWLLEQAGILLNDESVSGELASVRLVMREFSRQFKSITWVLGNHEDRLLRKLEAALAPSDLLRLLTVGDRWKSAPYYHCLLSSGGQTFRITHPRSAGNKTAFQIASREQQNVIMGHSHKWIVEHDVTGKLWAIQSGHCVDESRLAYVSQRDRGGYDPHCKGAVIVRDGYPFVLSSDFPFLAMQKRG